MYLNDLGKLILWVIYENTENSIQLASVDVWRQICGMASLIKSIFKQVSDLRVILEKFSAKLHHIKAHGALYNDLAKNAELSEVYLKSIEPFKNEANLYVPFQSEIAKTAVKDNFKVVYDADLVENSDEMQKENPIDPEKMAARIEKLFLTESGREVAREVLLA